MKYIGSITKKNINNKEYYYHQYRENGKMISRVLSTSEAYDLAFKLYYSKTNDIDEFFNHSFNTDISFGLSLYELEKDYASFKHRYIFKDLTDFLYNGPVGKIFILYGLRRTGKTTLMMQAISEMSIKDYAQAAFIRVNRNNNFQEVKKDLDYLTTHGFKYIFIDEVTLLDDFISLSSIFSDIYGARSRIVLSGTDSLGLYLAKYDELFDRAIFAHTTFISYKEFSEVLGIDSIDTYIEYGGTMSIDSNNYHNNVLDDDNYMAYVDSAIAHNITHSLKNYKNGDHFSHLFALYEKGELENVINRIIEDQNHRFAISVIERDFKSNDLGSLKQLIRKEKDNNVSSSLDDIDEEYVISSLMEALNVINRIDYSSTIEKPVLDEIKAYLKALDVVDSIKEVNISSNEVYERQVVIQPGIRYSQAKSLINILLNEEHVRRLPAYVVDIIRNKLDSDVKGRMLEEIVLYQTSLTNPNTFKLLFPVGEFDMVSIDDVNKSAAVYEIKHSSSIFDNQYRHISNNENSKLFEKHYYPIKSKTVLYLGNNKKLDTDINYINVSEYLKSI